jgi:polysaccharide biosynthesis protein PslG
LEESVNRAIVVSKRSLAALAAAALVLASPAPASAAGVAKGKSPSGIATGGWIQSDDPATLTLDLNGIAGANARWMRIDINWDQIQQDGPSSYFWTNIDRVVQGATTRGLKVLGTILYTPPWARPAGTTGRYAPNPNQYASFAATAVQHYSALGVHNYEVWNEPNNGDFWQPAPDVAAYTRLLKATYSAVKGADPEATVVTGATSPAPNDATHVAPVNFVQGIYASGGRGSFDAVGHHPYCFPAYPGDPQGWSAWYQMYGTSPSLRSVMTANGDASKKIWGTEWGAPSQGPYGVGETTQADMLTRAYQLWRGYTWSGPLFYYNHRDGGMDPSDYFGLMRQDFTPKPAYTAYQQAALS